MIETIDLATFTGTQVNDDQATAVIKTVTALARSYTRGGGFDTNGQPAEDIAAVILAASARVLGNPAGLGSETMGPFSVTYGPAGGFNWSVGERLVLDRYRTKAQ